MHWDLSNAHDERQVIPFGPDECDDYAEHDEGLGLGNFKPDEIPVPHPQCLCVQYAVIPQSLEDIGARIGAWASGEPDAVLDEWYDKYGNQNPNGDPKEILREGLKYRDFDDIISLQGVLTNREVREWYITHDATIPDLIDRTAPIEEQARQACELRNKFRTQARDLMPDQELRKDLDANEPNRSFEELIADKMRNKEMTREQAIADILKTATKTRKEVNKKFGLE